MELVWRGLRCEVFVCGGPSVGYGRVRGVRTVRRSLGGWGAVDLGGAPRVACREHALLFALRAAARAALVLVPPPPPLLARGLWLVLLAPVGRCLCFATGVIFQVLILAAHVVSHGAVIPPRKHPIPSELGS